MPTKAKARSWTDEDEQKGNAFLQILKGYAGKNMKERFSLYRNNAARQMGYSLYNHMPAGVKSFISSLGGKNGGKKKNKSNIDNVIISETKEQRWVREVDIHGLHPEDEAHIIEELSKSD
jgi:hypothetical protein